MPNRKRKGDLVKGRGGGRGNTMPLNGPLSRFFFSFKGGERKRGKKRLREKKRERKKNTQKEKEKEKTEGGRKMERYYFRPVTARTGRKGGVFWRERRKDSLPVTLVEKKRRGGDLLKKGENGGKGNCLSNG